MHPKLRQSLILMVVAALSSGGGILYAQSSIPKAYVVADLKVTDPAGFAKYAALVQKTMDPFGGIYMARGGKTVAGTGTIQSEIGRVSIIQFPDLARAQAWIASPAYQEIVPIRDKSAVTKAFLVEGLPGI
ncbi:MAG: DUF1330 domain-containing protein [Pseudomonadota bacterium]